MAEQKSGRKGTNKAKESRIVDIELKKSPSSNMGIFSFFKSYS